jgi:cell division protease FtsH
MEVIDEEVHKILEKASASALELLNKHKDGLEAVIQGLLEFEELDRHQIADLLGPSVHVEKESQLPERPPIVIEPQSSEATDNQEVPS